MNRHRRVKPFSDGPPRAPGPRGERTRRRLLEAAEALFSERPYDRASIVEITARAGVAMGTFYLYFRSKREIFRELVRDLGHRLRSEIARAVAGLSTRREVEQEGFRRFFEFTRRHPGLYRIVRQAEFFDPPSFVAYYRRLAEGYARGLERAMRSGEIRREDPELLAYALMGIGDMVGMRWILQRRPGAVPPRVLDALIRFAFEGMGSREEDQRRRPEATAGRGASSGGLGRPRQRARSSRTRSAAASK